ncbi:MAG: metallophosphoesterase family protein [Gemmatimonadota bacterium]
MATIVYPPFAKNRGPGYWLRPSNLWASRRGFLRSDHSNEWRHAFTEASPPPHHRSTPVGLLLGRPEREGFRFVVVGDTGEGDRSQHGLVPVIRGFRPDFLILNGDLAYPAGRPQDFEEGFFQPYSGLDLPIWAVPGNHEYYSSERGREFYEVFCTRRWAARWSQAGLCLVPQPGTYWELRSDAAGLVVLGVDSGMKGDLDGNGGHPPDRRQHFWLRTRLRVATVRGDRVIVLFHIPALKREKHEARRTHLTTLHQTVAEFPCVRLVICSHDHNFQQYSPETFERYLLEAHGAAVGGLAPDYVVVGGGGATLSGTDWSGPYPSTDRHPDRDQWREHASAGRKFLERSAFAKTLLSRIVAFIDDGARSDDDAARLTSFLLIEVEPREGALRTRATPIHVHDLTDLFAEDAVVDVRDPRPPFRPGSLDALRQPPIDV